MAVYTSNNLGSLLVTALKYTLGAGVVAAIINAILFAVVGIPADQTVQAPDGTQQAIGMVNFIMMSILPALIAGVLFALIAKFVPRPFLIFNIIATLIFIFMFFPPFEKVANASISTLILLQVSHVVVACAIMYALNNMWGAHEDETATA
jgi:Family of unknown function (DUF6069)